MNDFINELKSLLNENKDTLTELKELNTILTAISKTDSKLTKSALEEIINTSFNTAGSYGKKPAEYLSAVLDASEAGYKNAAEIAQLSLAAQTAGNLTAELANSYITAMDSAYKFEGAVEDLTEALDGTSNIANRNALSLAHLIEGMSAAGSLAASLGLEAGETTALLGTMTAVTNQSGKEMAEALKTILLYLGQMTDEEKGIGAEGLAAYENACLALNVSLRETRNGVTSLRSPMEIINDLAEEYSRLAPGDSRKKNLLDSIGGGTEAKALDALLSSHDLYDKMLDDYSNGIGSLSAEAEKAADSWEGSLNRLSSTWTGTIENIVKSDNIISVVNSLNTLLSGIQIITEALGPLGSIGLGAGLFAGLKNVGGDKMFSPAC